VTIQAGSQILQDPQSSGNSYIRLNFGGTEVSSYYCSPSSDDVTQYNCLALFSMGIPAYVPIMATCTLSSSGTSCSDSYTYSTAKSQ
jgi:hypothetical protein